MPTFADTSALYALLNRSDRRHSDAAHAAQDVRQRHEALWTIDAVIVELWRLLRGSFGHETADRLVREIALRGLRIEPSAREDYLRAWQFGADWADQDFSLTDRLCFAAIERARTFRAWSYDSEFAMVRLGPRRDRPLEILI